MIVYLEWTWHLKKGKEYTWRLLNGLTKTFINNKFTKKWFPLFENFFWTMKTSQKYRQYRAVNVGWFFKENLVFSENMVWKKKYNYTKYVR